jgi:hypothetical protein
MNDLDPRNYKNPIAGHNAKPRGGKNPLVRPTAKSGYSKSLSPLGAEIPRHGLAYRSTEDGAGLIEALGDKKASVRSQAVNAILAAVDALA